MEYITHLCFEDLQSKVLYIIALIISKHILKESNIFLSEIIHFFYMIHIYVTKQISYKAMYVFFYCEHIIHL